MPGNTAPKSSYEVSALTEYTHTKSRIFPILVYVLKKK